MCFPFLQFLRGIRDFKSSLKEVKTNLSDIKYILEGTLKISQDFEDVSSEFKNIVEFYSEESKNILRDQLMVTMTTEGEEELYHRDFIRYFKRKFENEITTLIEDYSTKISRIAILDIIDNMKRLLTGLKLSFEEDMPKLTVLTKLEVYLQESCILYKKGDSGADILTEVDECNIERKKSNIKKFCDKQKITQRIEKLLTNHFTSLKPGENHINYYEKSRNLVYRERLTRIRKFRSYLSTKIKIKKIGKFYKEEISFQVNIDLKKASKNIWKCEEHVKKYCVNAVNILRQLPKQRFSEVLEYDQITQLDKFICSCPRNTIRKNTTHMDESNVESPLEHIQTEVIEDKNYTDSNQISESECDISHSKKDIQFNDVIKMEIAEVLQNKDVQSFLCRGKSIIEKQEFFNRLQPAGNTDLVINIKKNYEELFRKNRLDSKDHVIRRTNELVKISSKPLFDLQLIYDDLEHLLRPLFDALTRKSTKYVIQLIENSHVFASKMLDVASNIDMILRKQENVEKKENIFIDKLFELLAYEMNDNEIKLFKKLFYAFAFTNDNKKKFIHHLENNIPDTAMTIVKKGKELIKDCGEEFLGGQREETVDIILELVNKCR